MSITVRAARPDEFPLIRDMLARAFKTDDEARLFDHLVAHDPSLPSSAIRVASAEGRPVACTVVLPRQIRTRQGLVPGAVVTLVACEPAYQGKGYGGATVQDALTWMEQQGLAVGVLFGHPGYYPRFGFVPVLAFQHTSLPVDKAPETGERMRPANAGDLSALTGLYAAHAGTYPCAVARPGEAEAAWLWQPRNTGAGQAVLLLPDRQGYAFVSHNTDRDQLSVHEAAAVTAEAARRLLGALAAEARTRGVSNVKLGLPPDQPLVRLALIHGAEQTYHPAAPGMAAVTRWEPLLPPGYAVDEQGLRLDGRLVLQAGRGALIQLVLGYRSVEDLLLEGACQVRDEARLKQDFPPLFPKWSLAPYWH